MNEEKGVIQLYVIPPRKKPPITKPIDFYIVRWYAAPYELEFDAPNQKCFLTEAAAMIFAKNQMRGNLPLPFVAKITREQTEINMDYVRDLEKGQDW